MEHRIPVDGLGDTISLRTRNGAPQLQKSHLLQISPREETIPNGNLCLTQSSQAAKTENPQIPNPIVDQQKYRAVTVPEMSFQLPIPSDPIAKHRLKSDIFSQKLAKFAKKAVNLGTRSCTIPKPLHKR